MQRGFSLIELVMVMVVLGTLAAIAAPRITAAQAGNRLTAAEQRLEHEFAAVGALARAKGAAHTVQIHLVSNELRVFEGTPSNLGAQVSSVDFDAEPYGVTFTSTTIGHPSGYVGVDAFGMYEAVAKVRIARGSAAAVVSLDGPLKGPAIAGAADEDEEAGGNPGLIGTLLGGLLGGLGGG